MQPQLPEIFCNGEYGGGDFNNLTSYTISYGNDKIVLDAGTLDTNWGDDNIKPKIVFLSHAHIDHTKDFLLNIEKFEGINIISDITNQELITLLAKEHENNKSGYRRNGYFIKANAKDFELAQKIDKLKIQDPSDFSSNNLLIDGFRINCFRLDHGGYNKEKGNISSWAIIIQRRDFYPILYFGDCTYNTQRESISKYFETIKEFVYKNKITFKYIFLECAFSDDTEDKYLFGHLKPSLLKSLIDNYNEIFQTSEIIITHRKPKIEIQDEIKFNFDDSEIIKIKHELQQIQEELFSKYEISFSYPNKKQFIINQQEKHTQLSSIEELSLELSKIVFKHISVSELKEELFNLIILSAPLFQICNQKKLTIKIKNGNVKDYEFIESVMNDKFWPQVLNDLFEFTPQHTGGYLKIKIKKHKKTGKRNKKNRKRQSNKKRKIRQSNKKRKIRKKQKQKTKTKNY